MPVAGSKRDMLGVRENGADIPVDTSGIVRPGTGGLSVAPSWQTLPPFLISRRLTHKLPEARGNARLACFRLGQVPFQEGTISDELTLRPDSTTHATIEPGYDMLIMAFNEHLAATREQWVLDED